MKKETFYFSHDYNARNDTKILYMRNELGMEGYGIYWYLIEALADAGGILPLKILPVLAKQMDATLVKVEGVVNNYELFEVSENEFVSQRLLKHLEYREILSEQGKKGALKRWSNGGANGGAISHPNAKESKGKEIKVKEIKESNTHLLNSNLFRQPIIPEYDELKQFFINSGGSEEMAKIFFDKNSATGWFLKGSPITNYRSLIPSFISNFKNNKNGKPTTAEDKFNAYKEYANRYS
jgi:hypothetical protein